MSNSLENIIQENIHVLDRVRELVQGVIIADQRGQPIHSHYDNNTSQVIINSVGKTLADVANSAIRHIDPTDDLRFLRLKTRKGEYIAGIDKEFTIIIVQV